MPEDGLSLSGMSYDNTVGLGASTWRHVAFIEQPVSPGDPAAGHALADVQRRVQALHRGGLPGRVPDRGAVPHRVRHRGGAGRHLQRLRLLRAGLPVRRHRPARGGPPGAQVHAVLRPARGRPGAGLRQGLPDQVDPVRPAGRAARAGPAAGRGPAARPARTRPGCTWRTRPTASAAAGRSSCCSTSPRCTACRRTRWSPPGTCRACGSTWRSPRPAWPAPRSPSAWGSAGEQRGPPPEGGPRGNGAGSPRTGGHRGVGPRGKQRRRRLEQIDGA